MKKKSNFWMISKRLEMVKNRFEQSPDGLFWTVQNNPKIWVW
jgi:hypothetical protein